MVWVKRTDAEEEPSSSPDEGSEEPLSAEGPTEAEEDSDSGLGLEEFSQGRVYNASLAKQVHVFPTPASSDIEVTMESCT